MEVRWTGSEAESRDFIGEEEPWRRRRTAWLTLASGPGLASVGLHAAAADGWPTMDEVSLIAGVLLTAFALFGALGDRWAKEVLQPLTAAAEGRAEREAFVEEAERLRATAAEA